MDLSDIVGRPLLCRLGFHSWARADGERGHGPIRQVCRACFTERETISYPGGGSGGI